MISVFAFDVTHNKELDRFLCFTGQERNETGHSLLCTMTVEFIEFFSLLTLAWIAHSYFP